MARMLRILHRLNGMYLDDERLEREAGEELASRKDFEGPLDVVPVSDPNIFSEAQRYAQVQAVSQRAAALPQLYDMRAVEERLLETLKVPNPKELLVPPMEPKEQNGVNENVAATLGRPITAFPEQDHIAHLKTHLAYMMSPTFGMSPMIAPAFLPVMLNHIKEHVALWYAASVFDVSNEALGSDVGDMLKEMGKDVEGRKALDQMLAEAGAAVVQRGNDVFADLPQVVQQAQQVMQQFAPQPMADPRLALETQKLQAEAQSAQQKMQLEQQKMQVDAQQEQQNNQIDMAELQARIQIEQQQQQAEDARKAAELQARMSMNSQDNETAMQLAAAEIASGEKIAVSTGTGINPNP